MAAEAPDEQFDKATSVISNLGVRRCHCQDLNSSSTCHSFLVPAPPAHWLIKNDFGIDLWRRSSTLWRIDFSPTSPDLVSHEISVAKGTTVLTCSIRHPKLHKLIEASALLAMRDSDSDYTISRRYPILYLRQYSDPELRGCDALGDSEEEQLVKAVYKDIDHMPDNLKSVKYCLVSTQLSCTRRREYH